MAKIKDVYSNDDYYPFILYCENHGYEEMTDLMKCQFQNLRYESEIPPRLLSKIKTLYVLYCKAHSSEFIQGIKTAQKTAGKAAPDAAIENELELYFQKNADKLIHITDITKSIGKKAKRNDILKILEAVPWCKAVDSTTYFYASKA